MLLFLGGRSGLGWKKILKHRELKTWFTFSEILKNYPDSVRFDYNIILN